MNTANLVKELGRKSTRVSRYALLRRVSIGLIAGSLVASIAVNVILGTQPDLTIAMQAFPFWMKWTYTVSLGVGAVWALTRIARPRPGSLQGLWLLAVPFLILASIATGELTRTPSVRWSAMWLGGSWSRCPLLVLALAAPIFLGLLWSFRSLAPTHLRAAGAIAGLASGAWAAAIYCLHCREVSAIFVLTWYTLGIGLAVTVGALLGPRLFRW